MNLLLSRRTAVLLSAAALAPLAQAQAAGCPTSGATAITVGTVASVAPAGARSYSVGLAAGEGVIVDVASLAPKPVMTDGEDDHEHGRATPPPAAQGVRLCNAAGTLLAPQPGEVFAKGGSLTSTDDGQRLRFFASSAGQYVITIDQSDAPREVLVRRRAAGSAPQPIISAVLDTPQKGITSSGAPMVFSFGGSAGQWVELKSTSEKDTVLRLAGPDRAGAYAQLAENDDSEGTNPVIRRKLPVSGMYYVQVDSLSDDPGEFELTLKKIAAPKPPPPPVRLSVGSQVAGKLADGNDIRLYTMPVVAGHSYRLELTAPYDGVVGIGVPNPVESEDGDMKADAGFADIKSQDTGTTGTERLNFTARENGQLLVRVKSFGIGETDGAYSLTASDVGN